MGSPLEFEITHRCRHSRARVGRVSTPHGVFDTPAFMPVGTRGSVKGVLPAQVRQTGAQILLNNTYHLMLRPGADLVERLGGVHAFMNWDGPILTDSGGYQAYSMADLNAVDDDGVSFRSIIDGSKIRLTPERATQIQNQLGPDIMMAFDDCPPSSPACGGGAEPSEAEGVCAEPRAWARAVVEEGASDSPRAQGQAVGSESRPTQDRRLARARKRDQHLTHEQRLDLANERTVRWLERCKAAHAKPDEQALFGIIQGGTDPDRRAWSVERVCNIDLPGYAIGGVAVGESPEDIARVVRLTAPQMPENKPRYLMGVGYERDIVSAVLAGVDMFDCVLPTRNARNANAFTRGGQIRLKNAKFADDPDPIEPGCSCPACDPAGCNWPSVDGRPFSRAYLRHLFAAGEMLGPILTTLHNLHHFQRLMSDLRSAIGTGDWGLFANTWTTCSDLIPGRTIH